MEVNGKINKLLADLELANKIYLNDNMYLIKLHNNQIFLNWLKNDPENKLEFKFKDYHNIAWKMYNGVPKSNSDDIVEFITIGIIKQNSLKDVKFICCQLDIGRVGNVYFGDRSKQGNGTSGVIFNGSYFFLANHVREQMYGVDRWNDELINKPIGYYRYLQQKDYSINPREATDASSLQPLKNTRLELFSLNWVSDTLGILKVDKDGIFSIRYAPPYNEKVPMEFDPLDQVLMGNILVYDGNIVMTEDKLAKVIVKADVVDIPKYTTAYICDKDGKILSGSDISKINANDRIFITADRPRLGNIVRRASFSYDFIFMPYNFTLIQKVLGGAAGLVPPGMPAHASDLNPRTCLLIDENNNIMVIHVEGRNLFCGGQGLDLFDLAKLCKRLGAVYAINLDGGGSSKIEWKEIGVRADYAGADDYSISNAIAIVPKGATIIEDVADVMDVYALADTIPKQDE
ncbi:MAG: phosphodiester glycosidase family protein [Edafosvirus sp.]|uniref:Phosphodiester glycosidase family protein n=1 Tax=Edafosvirus sp. TaxID=2487765 RepID=A0A3G4ZUS0_9VIRU|nr:MAG: phosphodiester glycosidase family protein [Edafosvirus sp.]